MTNKLSEDATFLNQCIINQLIKGPQAPAADKKSFKC